MTAASQRTALIAGGSIGGLMIGAILAREGWKVRIFEKVAGGIENRGAGIATHADLVAVFARAGARFDDDMGIGLQGRTAFDRAGDVLCRYPYYQLLSSWSNLYRRLLAAVPPDCYHLGHEVVQVDDRDDGVGLQFANGQRMEGDLLIGADGVWSQVRAQLAPDAVPSYCGYVAWRGLLDEKLLPEAFCEFYSPIHAFYVDRGEQFIMYAVAGTDESVAVGRRRFGFLWYHAVDQETELPALLTDVEGRYNGLSISPARIQPQHVERLRRDAEAMLPPDFAKVVLLTPQPFIQPIYDLASTRIAFKRTAIVGDAAFVARPHVGAGVLKAGSDAMALADALRDHASVTDALKAYEATRLPAGAALIAKARYLGSYLEGSRRKGPPAPVLPVEEVIRESGRG